MAPRDWRNARDYEDLQDLHLPGLAWEFLRRETLYRLEFEALQLTARQGVVRELSRRWGLRFAADPDLPAAEAPLYWRADAAPAHVIVLVPSPRGGAPAGELAELSLDARSGEDGLHLRLPRGLQLFVPPVDAWEPLAAEAPVDEALGARIAALRELERLRAARGPGADPLSPLGRRRTIQKLRAADGRAAGASYREIAEALLAAAPEDPLTWRTSSVRDVAIRLCRSAQRLVAGEYLKLLRQRR